MYECNPLRFIIEPAGGLATNGRKHIMEIVPESIHEFTPVYIGSRQKVEK